jgi:multidrug efflux system outer membrane protein
MSKIIISESILMKRTLIISLILSLGACSMVGLDYFRPKQALPEQYQAASTEVSNTLVSSDWWKLYQDPVLDDLIAKASVNNTDIKIAVARIEEADGYLREVGAALLPQVNLDAGTSRNKVTELGAVPLFNGMSSTRTNYNVRLGTVFELDFWGKLRRSQEAARAQALGSRYAKDTVDLSLKGLIANNYLFLRSLETQINLSKESLHTREESLALTKRRLEGGIASALDVSQAEVACANLKAQLYDLERQRQIVEQQLAVLTGVMGLRIESASLDQMPVPPIPPAGLPSSLLESRPDVRLAEQNLIAANAKIGVAKAALYPTISLTASYGGESKDLGDVLKSAARIWTGGVGLYLPVFDSGRINAKIDQVTAQQKQALAAYERSVQQAFQEVNDALVNLRQYTESESALRDSEQASRRALDIANHRYQSGYVAYLDVLDAQRVYNDSALAYVRSRQARLGASVGLFKALGGGWQEPASALKK